MNAGDGKSFTIFGAGLAGTLMAVYLARQGRRVELFERRADPRGAATERGRSINLALSTRGIDALQRVGLAEEVLAEAIPMRGRMIHPRSGPLAFTPYSRDPAHAINSVSRAGLNIALLNAAAREPGVSVRFGVRCLGVDFGAGRAEVADATTGTVSAIEAGIVIGADGAFSGVRLSMQRLDRFEYQQTYLEHGYKELTIPPRAGGAFAIEKHALHIWPRGTYMMIALPNQDGSFTCTLFWPFEGPHSFTALRTDADIRRFFEDQFPDAVPLIPSLVSDFQHNPAASLVTVRCSPWHVGGRAVLIGDAAHAVVPFYGQGMNASFEDCRVLAECLARAPGDPGASFAEYERLRKPNTDALARLACDNFIEMRDKAGTAAFRRRKAFEHALERRLPGWYTSLYEMITFSTMPYAEALQKARDQDRLIARLLAGILLGLILLGVSAAVLRSTGSL